MQEEILAADPSAPVSILGVNAVGQESDNALNCAGRTIPWLQDQANEDAWALWGVTWRDVYVLDGENRLVAIYNLTSKDLANPANYAELKALILSAVPP
jgi:hypothetical protein